MKRPGSVRLAPWSDTGPPPARYDPGPLRPVGEGPHAVAGFLLRRRWEILGTLAVVVVAAAAATGFMPASYRSTTTVLIERQRGERGEAPALSALERLGRASVLETETELIRSRRVVVPVVDSLDLHVEVEIEGRKFSPHDVFREFHAGHDVVPGEYRIEAGAGGEARVEDQDGRVVARGAAGDAIAFGGIRAMLPGEPLAAATVRVKPLSAAVAEVLETSLEVEPVHRDGDLLRVACAGSSPERAQGLCAAVAAGYVDLRAELQRADAATTAEFLRGQVARLGDSLAAAEARLQGFKQRAEVVALDDQATEEVRQYALLKAQRDAIEAERTALARFARRIEQGPGGTRRYRDLASFPALLANPTVSHLMQQLAELETRRADLARRRTEQNPELAALDGRIAQIDRQLGSIASQYERSLTEQVRSYDRAVGGSRGRLSTYPSRQVEAARHEREVASLGVIYDMLEARLREAEIAEAVNRPPVGILDEASLPLRPDSPNARLNLLLALVLGLGLGLAVALVREYTDTTIHDREALARRTSLPVLAMVPTVPRPRPVLPVSTVAEEPRGSAEDARSAALVPAGWRARARRAPLVRGNGSRPEEEVTLEVFRSLGADLHFVARRLPRGDLRSVAITGAGRGEGKTYVACNLALVRASHGVHTLLVDADMRAGGVASFLGLQPAAPGLSEFLAGRANARDARRTVRVGDGHELAVLPAGASTPDAAELLGTPYFEAMLAGAQAVYDLVVIDTPPLHVLADAATVVASVDAVLLVVREGVTDAESLDISLERIERAGGNVVGIVFNDVRVPRRYASYAGYSYAT